MERDNGKTQFITMAGVIAAAYVVLTFIAQTVGLASGAIQFRLSEVLTILPMFTTAAIPGLAVGCVLANILTGCALWDVVFGSIATLLGNTSPQEDGEPLSGMSAAHYLKYADSACSPDESIRSSGELLVSNADSRHR